MSAVIPKANQIKHFVDLLRESYLWSILEKKPDWHADNHSNNKKKSGTSFSPSVTELHEAGVRFEVSRSKNLFHISFKDGVLETPARLRLEDSTETLFRNMMVFEQFHHYPNNYITDYFLVLDSLINTEDVEILVEKGIIDNWLGSNEEAAKLINNICIHVLTCSDNFYYSGVCQELNKYKSRRWPKHKAALKRKYFNHPWAFISLVYATLLLILAVLQVITGFTK